MQKFEDVSLDSAQYRVTPRSIILRGVKFRAVSYCAELSPQIWLPDSTQYDTARNLTPRSMILSRDSEKFEYLSEDKIKNKNILTHWSVAHASSNDEKTGGRKSRWTVPLRNMILQSNLQPTFKIL